MLIFDSEIKKMILGRNERQQPDLQYCAGWSDYRGMGISVICAWDSLASQMHTLTPQDDEGHASQLQTLISTADYVVGFNNHGFDNNLLEAAGFKVPKEKSYDIYEQVIAAAGLSDAPFYERKGYRLDDLARVNNLPRKNDDGGGAMAPALYQRGEIERLHSYCANDVLMTVELMTLVLNQKVICPRSFNLLPVKTPLEVLGSTQVGLF
jgi:hypothetical protein